MGTAAQSRQDQSCPIRALCKIAARPRTRYSNVGALINGSSEKTSISPTTPSAVQEKINYELFNCYVLAACSFHSFIRSSFLVTPHSLHSQASAPRAKVAHSRIPQCQPALHSPERLFPPPQKLFVVKKNYKKPNP